MELCIDYLHVHTCVFVNLLSQDQGAEDPQAGSLMDEDVQEDEVCVSIT